MKAYHFILIYIMILAMAFTGFSVRFSAALSEENRTRELQTALDDAAYAALMPLRGLGNVLKDDDCDAALRTFTQAFADSMGVSDFPDSLFPLIAVSDVDGVRLSLFFPDGESGLMRCWTEKFLFCGDPAGVLSSVLSEYAVGYDGDTYVLSFPEQDAVYAAANSGISFVAIVRGFPISATGRTYSSFAAANTGVAARNTFLVCDDGLYHAPQLFNMETHGVLRTVSEECLSEYECALKGAYACPICFPDHGMHRR